ncbi:MAG: hypothetical protein HFG05_12630 [Oscillibacter sp.]|nr:hypothetical protein [Oscillibacter sp.]
MENRKRALNLGALFENAVLRVRIQWDGQKSLFTSFLRLLKIGRVKSPETTDAVGFPPTASKVGFLLGTPDWIRTSGLQSRSFLTYKGKTL